MLERISPSPLHALNRAVALAECQGAAAGLAVLADNASHEALTNSYLWQAVLADLHQRAGYFDDARWHRENALRSAPTAAIRDALSHRFARIPAANAQVSTGRNELSSANPM
jgi:RNA polymerase sigma-70 factor (ECF subfamily)